MTVNNTVPPVVSDTTPQVGQTIRTTDGTWTYDLDYLTYTYQWRRCDEDGLNCSDITGATNANYVVQAADAGSTLQSEVTAVEHSYPANPSEPAPIAGQGYSVVFEDDFTSLNTNVWRLGAWYIPESPANYTQAGSTVTIHNHPSERTQRDLMTRSLAFQYGYFEARMRYTQNTDVWASHWMMSDNWIRTGNCNTLKISEIDVFEAFHNLENPTTYKSASSTIHRNTSGACGMADQFKSPNFTNDTGFTLANNWRTYSCLWTPTQIKFYVDETLHKTHSVWDTTNQPHRVFLACWSHTFSAELTTEIDYYRVWQLDNTSVFPSTTLFPSNSAP